MASAVAFAQNPVAADSPYQIKYASNLTVGDSVINISNSGAAATALNIGTSISGNGTICANVYVFDYREEFLSCCACPVTPNGVQSYSVKSDLLFGIFPNSYIPPPGSLPTSVVVKILATR
jgi:hypothetical protein